MNSSLQKDLHGIFVRCVEDSNDAIMITDIRGNLLYVNRAWQSIYGYSSQEVLGQSPRILRSPHQASDFYQKMWAEILDPAKGYWRGELVNLSKSGQEVPVLLSITPYRDGAEKILGYMGIALDIREKKQLEAQILQQDRLASVGLLASGLAHEIGTPLGVVRGRAEYLAMLSGNNQKLREGLEIIVAQIDRISKLIHALLHLARSSKQESSVPVDVPHILNEVRQLLETKLQKANTQLTVDLPQQLAVKADRDRLIQVFLNLIINSIQAIESKAKDASGNNSIRVFSKITEQGFVHISILDSGTGISIENKNNLFKPFFTTKEVGQGTGLGLAIIHQIVHSWGGRILVDSTEGQGACFTLVLPTR